MNIKKILAVLLAVTVSLLFSGCNEVATNSSGSISEEVSTEKTRDYMTLLYSATDTFNPYTLKTNINRQLCMLLYEPLVKLDNQFEPIYSIANTVTTNGKKCVVTLNNVVFSDGSAVTASDVVYSCNLARGAGNSYAYKLYSVVGVAAANSYTVEFTLSKADPYFVNLLDFPIIKANSDKVTDSDSVVQPPVGCGRYVVSADRQSLEINQHYSGEQSSIKKIRLINSPDSESVSHYAQIGAADMYYSDISDGNILRISGKKLDVNLNNIVYIGVNQNYGPLAYPEMRQALASALDRSKICKDSYYNNAIPATGFFNPVWKAASSVQNIQITANKEITIENLEKIGYNSLDGKGIRINSSGTTLSFTLLVNSENRIKVSAAQNIASQLLEVGIKINVIEKSYADYIGALNAGQFQLFLGEVKLTDNMDISCLVSTGGSAAYGLPVANNGTVENSDDSTDAEQQSPVSTEPDLSLIAPGDVVNGFYEGYNTIADIASVLQTNMPFVPVCYRTGVLFCNEKIENIKSFSASDIYSSINSYIINQ